MINSGDIVVIAVIGILFIGSIFIIAPTFFRDYHDD
jgi:hypothetical protein